MEQLLYKLLSDFGITGAMYVIMLLAFIRFLPKYLEKQQEEIKEITQNHKDQINTLTERFERITDKIVSSFEKQIAKSDERHKQHQAVLQEVKNDVKDVKSFLIRKINWNDK